MTDEIDCDRFVRSVRPLVEANDRDRLIEFLAGEYPVSTLSSLIVAGSSDCRKVAAVCLSLVATPADAGSFAVGLRDADPMVVQFTEHALWTVWFRGESPAANGEVCRGAKAICRREFTSAVAHFDRAIEISPRFAEPYNQRAIARYLQDEFEASITDCRRAIRLMPCHFGAMAGLGHCFLHLGQLPEALAAYDKALAIHPGLESVAQTAKQIRETLTATV